MTSSSKQSQIAAVKKHVLALTSSPLYAYRTKHHYQPVIGEGSLDARLMFIGEAPGQKEAETGRPFVGAAGRILDQLLAAVHLDRNQIYITNIVNDRPPGNRDPLPQEIDLYSPFLIQQIKIIKPRVLATLGRFSMAFLMDRFRLKSKLQPISRIHGQVFSTRSSYGQVYLMPLYHPAVALYRAPMKSVLLKDFQLLSHLLKKKD